MRLLGSSRNEATMVDSMDELEASRIALTNHGYEVEEIYEGGGISITKRTGTSDPSDGAELRDEAQEIVDTVCGGTGPDVQWPVEGGREGQFRAHIAWE